MLQNLSVQFDSGTGVEFQMSPFVYVAIALSILVTLIFLWYYFRYFKKIGK